MIDLEPDDGSPAVFPIRGYQRVEELRLDDFVHDREGGYRLTYIDRSGVNVYVEGRRKDQSLHMANYARGGEFEITRLVDENLDRA